MRKKMFVPILLTLVIAFMDISGLPSAALFEISFKDVDIIANQLPMQMTDYLHRELVGT